MYCGIIDQLASSNALDDVHLVPTSRVLVLITRQLSGAAADDLLFHRLLCVMIVLVAC